MQHWFTSQIAGYDIRDWKTGDPCYAAGKCLVKLSSVKTQKAELIPTELGGSKEV